MTETNSRYKIFLVSLQSISRNIIIFAIYNVIVIGDKEVGKGSRSFRSYMSHRNSFRDRYILFLLDGLKDSLSLNGRKVNTEVLGVETFLLNFPDIGLVGCEDRSLRQRNFRKRERLCRADQNRPDEARGCSLK